jgi:hypothetical protein
MIKNYKQKIFEDSTSMKLLTTLLVSLAFTTLIPLQAMEAEVPLINQVSEIFNQHRPGLHGSDALEKKSRLNDALEAIRNNLPLDTTGITPLDLAVQENKREWLEFILLDQKKYITTCLGDEPVGIYTLKRSDNIGYINRFREAVIGAIRNKTPLSKVKSKVINAGLNQPLDGNGTTALHLATLAQFPALITHLLGMGALLKKNIIGKNPLDLARDLENLELIALLEPMDGKITP